MSERPALVLSSAVTAKPAPGEVRVADARVEALETRDVVARVPLVRNAREESPQKPLSSRRSRAPPRDAAAASNSTCADNAGAIAASRPRFSATRDLAVRIPQPVEVAGVIPLLAEDGQIAGLEQQRLRLHPLHVERGEIRVAHHQPFQRRRRKRRAAAAFPAGTPACRSRTSAPGSPGSGGTAACRRGCTPVPPRPRQL